MPTLDFYYRNVLGRRLQSAEMDANNQLYAQAYDTIVSISASVAATANFKGNWSALTGPLTVPASVAHSGSYWMLLSNLADVTAATPGVSASWQLLPAGNVQGPVSSVDGDGVVFDGATGKLTKSLGAAPVKKTGDTMTGPLVLPANGVTLGTDQLVASGGLVGIGTNAPQARLHVGTPAATANAVIISDATNYTLQAGYVSAGVGHFGGAAGSALRLRANGVDTLQLNPNGAVLAVAGPLGYGVGTGGTVTQPTSKSAAVALNKACGQITMNNAALAANTTVSFTLVNSLISAGDTLALEIVSGAAAFTNYRLLAGNAVTAGQRGIAVTNQSGGSLSEAIVIQFNIIKGATS